MRSASAASSAPVGRIDDDLRRERARRRAPRRASAAGSSRNSSCAAASGTIAVVSGAVRVGCRMPTTSNGTPRRSTVPPTPRRRARGRGPSRGRRPAIPRPRPSGGAPGPACDLRLSSPWSAPATAPGDDLGHAEAGELALFERHLDLRVDRRHAGHGADLSASARSIGTRPMPMPLVGAVADDDLADVVVAAARRRSR